MRFDPGTTYSAGDGIGGGSVGIGTVGQACLLRVSGLVATRPGAAAVIFATGGAANNSPSYRTAGTVESRWIGFVIAVAKITGDKPRGHLECTRGCYEHM